MITTKRTILLTGAAGRIGTAYLKHAGTRYTFRLLDIRDTPQTHGHESIISDLADPEAANDACVGVDTVVHLAADPRPSAEFYQDLLGPNFKATYNIFRAAKQAGCRRVVFASSVNAIFGYPVEKQVRTLDAPCPGNIYGVSKAFGESLGAYFGAVEGLSNICIRIGGVGDLENIRENTPHFDRSIFVTYRDLCHLLDLCIETPDISHAVVHGLSNNRHSLIDLTDTRKLLNYHPVDDAFNP
jgi:nucleoside-diphosphate-sugar epimerase